MAHYVPSDSQEFDDRWEALKEQQQAECKENLKLKQDSPFIDAGFPVICYSREETVKTLEAAFRLFHRRKGEVLTSEQLKICREAIKTAATNVHNAYLPLRGSWFVKLEATSLSQKAEHYITLIDEALAENPPPE